MEDNSKDRVGYWSHAIDRSDLQPGDHIYVYNSWLGYSHHGIYIGNNEVIHLTGQGKQGGWSSGISSRLSSGSSSGGWSGPSSGSGLTSGSNSFAHSASKLTAQPSQIQSCTLNEFLNGNQLRLVAYGASSSAKRWKRAGSCHTCKCRSANEVIKTAKYYLKNPQAWGDYDVIKNNCEHFAHYCKTKEMESAQGSSWNLDAKK